MEGIHDEISSVSSNGTRCLYVAVIAGAADCCGHQMGAFHALEKRLACCLGRQGHLVCCHRNSELAEEVMENDRGHPQQT